MISFDDDGNFVDASRLEVLLEGNRDPAPTHVFVLAHGWNNSQDDAIQSYTGLMELMTRVADKYALRPAGYRPLIIGVRWPSKAWDEESRKAEAAGPRRVDAATVVAVYENFPARNSPDTHAADVLKMQELLARDAKTVKRADVDEALRLFQRYALDAKRSGDPVDDESVFDRSTPSPALLEGSSNSIRDLFRIFTYWQMKKRAGIVGGNGVRAMLARLQKEFPQAAVHLVGHSFGCKLVLSSLAGQGQAALSKPVDSVVLLQGAISFQAFAPRVTGTNPSQPGGYRIALERVKGPIVTTFTSNDKLLLQAYPLGSRLARQVGELEAASKYSALGAVGPDGIAATSMQPEGKAYAWTHGLQSIKADAYIDGHSGVQKPEVAWLIWSAVVRR